MNPFTLIAAVLGFVLIVAGAAWIYLPLGPLVGGTVLLLAAHGSTRTPAKI